MIQALLFDMDGLIFDTEGLHKSAWQHAAKEQGLDLNDDFYQQFIGVQTPACEQMLAEHFGNQLNLERFRQERDARMLVLKADPVPYKEGFHQLFELAMDKGLQCALVTSSRLKDVLHHFNGSDYLSKFTTLVTAEKVTNGKPAPDCYLMAAEHLGIAPARCLVLEDSNNGMQAGLDAGCQAAMIPDLLAPREDILKRANYILPSLHQVCELLEGNQ